MCDTIVKRGGRQTGHRHTLPHPTVARGCEFHKFVGTIHGLALLLVRQRYHSSMCFLNPTAGNAWITSWSDATPSCKCILYVRHRHA